MIREKLLPNFDVAELARGYEGNVLCCKVVDGELRCMDGKLDPINQSFNWSAEEADKMHPVTGLAEVHRQKTYHTYGYYGLFKPSEAECMTQYDGPVPVEQIDAISCVCLNAIAEADPENSDGRSYLVGETIYYTYGR